MLIPQQETLSVLCNQVGRNNDVLVSALEICQKEFKLLTYHKKSNIPILYIPNLNGLLPQIM